MIDAFVYAVCLCLDKLYPQFFTSYPKFFNITQGVIYIYAYFSVIKCSYRLLSQVICDDKISLSVCFILSK